ncbi:fibronectin type III domain-containing protein [Marinobacter sp. F4206]|nr:fibronectin type III domain-containing protein [Marinobacter sp. F4206]
MAAFLSGCGLDASDDSSITEAQSPGTVEPTAQVAGAAIKGVIQQGVVTANRLLEDKSGYYLPDRLAAKPVRTADDGSYELRLRGKADGWALVELRADGSTRMVCDVVPSCDQVGGGQVEFGQTLELSSDFVLRGAGDLVTETVHLTPLTHLAVTLAERSDEGLSPAALAGAYQTVEAWFGLSVGALSLVPPDLTRLDELEAVSADALQVAITNAAFLALVNDNDQWQSISDVLNNMSAQVVASGRLDITGDGTSLALADIVAASAAQASELQLVTESSIIDQKLVIVEYRNVQRFKTIADVYSGSDDGDTSVADTTEPPTTEPAPEPAIPADAALLSWTAPLTRENGVSLSMGEIAGFEVVYGKSADALDQSIAIGDASVDELLVDDLSEGTWYFAMRTLDTDGNRSSLSEMVSKQI